MIAPEEYSAKEFNDTLALQIKSMTFSPIIAPQTKPIAILLGGQSGAGKTTLHDVFKIKLADNVLIINGDEYRALHPRFSVLQRLYGDKAVDYTAPWAGRMTEALIDALSHIGYNLIIEGTLHTADVPMKTAALLRERGYAISLALMAVKPQISLVSCQLRYEEMRIAGTTPRATDPTHHNKIIQQIVSNLTILEESGLFDGTYLYTRRRDCIFPRNGFEGSASEALQEALFGPWTEEELGHLRYLEAKLQHLKDR